MTLDDRQAEEYRGRYRLWYRVWQWAFPYRPGPALFNEWQYGWASNTPLQQSRRLLAPPSSRTPAPWVSHPHLWREPQRRTPIRFLARCVQPVSWDEVTKSFEAVAGCLLTGAEFIEYAGLAYGFVVKKTPRWNIPIPDGVRELDVKRDAVSLAFIDVLDGEHFLGPFTDFGHFVNSLRRRAQHASRRSGQALAWGVREPLPAHLRRRRHREVECPWCWSAVVTLKTHRVCSNCHTALPGGVTVVLPESVCRRYAADPNIGPGVPFVVELGMSKVPHRDRNAPRYRGSITHPDLMPAKITEKIAALDRERYSEDRPVELGGLRLPLRATDLQVNEEENWMDEYALRHLQKANSINRGWTVLHSSVYDQPMARIVDKGEDGDTARLARRHRAKDGAHEVLEMAHVATTDGTDGAARELEYVRAMIQRLVTARRAIIREMEPLEPTTFAFQVTRKGTEPHRARLREQRALRKQGGRVLGQYREPSSEAGRQYAGLDSACYDLTYKLDDLVIRRSRLLSEDETCGKTSLYISDESAT